MNRKRVAQKGPGFFRVEHPDQLRHMDMADVWVAEHGWCCLSGIIDRCTREIPGWALDVRCRGSEAAAGRARRHRGPPARAGAATRGTASGAAVTTHG